MNIELAEARVADLLYMTEVTPDDLYTTRTVLERIRAHLDAPAEPAWQVVLDVLYRMTWQQGADPKPRRAPVPIRWGLRAPSMGVW